MSERKGGGDCQKTEAQWENEWEKDGGRKGGVSEKVIQAPAVILLCQARLIDSSDN